MRFLHEQGIRYTCLMDVTLYEYRGIYEDGVKALRQYGKQCDLEMVRLLGYPEYYPIGPATWYITVGSTQTAAANEIATSAYSLFIDTAILDAHYAYNK